MAQTSADGLKITPLNSRHRALGARLVDFSGWEMPVEYSGLSKEHLAVRRSAGLFDVSHMGEIEIAGNEALQAVQKVCTNDAAQLSIGEAQYSALLTEVGTVIDDVLVYKLADGHYMLVVNAGNIAKDFAWIRQQITGVGDAVAVNTSSRYALIAVQGPLAARIVQTLTEVELETIEYYTFATGEVSGVRATISRTGYTGEDGFELFVPPQSAPSVWETVQRAGESPRRDVQLSIVRKGRRCARRTREALLARAGVLDPAGHGRACSVRRIFILYWTHAGRLGRRCSAPRGRYRSRLCGRPVQGLTFLWDTNRGNPL